MVLHKILDIKLYIDRPFDAFSHVRPSQQAPNQKYLNCRRSK